MKINAPHPTDILVGARIRLRRNGLKKSQTWLAEELGITFQQVQKYERGTNRVSASRLFEIATILQVQIGYFFGEIERRFSQRREGMERRA